MRAVDSSFVVDLLPSVPAAASKAADLDRDPEIIAIPSPCMAEVVRGAHLVGAPEVRRAEELLAQLEASPRETPAAHAAGVILGECADRGREVPLSDCLIAGIVRTRRLSRVTRDVNFSRISGLVVEKCWSSRRVEVSKPRSKDRISGPESDRDSSRPLSGLGSFVRRERVVPAIGRPRTASLAARRRDPARPAPLPFSE